MPLDLKSCTTGIPPCQPTFDLTKKQFMPHKNVERVREMMKSRQHDKVFGKKMEINMVRGKPAITYSDNSTTEGEDVLENKTIFQPIGRWWRRSRSQSVRTENDSFTLTFDNEELSQMDGVSSPWLDGAVPFTYPQQVTTTNDYELIVKNEQEIYQQYYNHPIGPEYLTLSHSPQRDEELSRFRQRQNRQFRPDSWFEGCIGWKIPYTTC